MAERITGLGRKTRQEIVKWNQMTALRFQTGGRHQTSLASVKGKTGGDVSHFYVLLTGKVTRQWLSTAFEEKGEQMKVQTKPGVYLLTSWAVYQMSLAGKHSTSWTAYQLCWEVYKLSSLPAEQNTAVLSSLPAELSSLLAEDFTG